jgi:hypothetical protein
MNISFNKKYNNVDWNVTVFIYNNTITLNSPDEMEETNGILVLSESILLIQLENSVSDPVPKAVFQIIDDKFGITNYLKTQNCKILLSLSRPFEGSNDRINAGTFTLKLLVDSYDIINMNVESVTYRISCVLDNSIPLNTLCEYATQTPENPYEIAYKILKNSGYNLFPIETRSEKNIVQQTKYHLPSTECRCNFITYQNMKVMDAIMYLLSAGGSGYDEPAYLIHNMFYDKGFITSRKNLMTREWIDTQPPVTRIDFNFSTSDIGETHLMKFLSTKSSLGGIEAAKLYNNYEFFLYDHTTREWDSELITKKDIEQTLTSFKDPMEDHSIFSVDDISEDATQSLKYQFPTINLYYITDVKRNLDLYSSNLQFTVTGNLELDVGYIIKIDESRSGNEKIEQFNGLWMISKVLHTFSDQIFKTNVILSRVTYTKNLVNKLL